MESPTGTVVQAQHAARARTSIERQVPSIVDCMGALFGRRSARRARLADRSAFRARAARRWRNRTLDEEDRMSLRALALLGFASIGALPLRADVIPPGHKPVEHVLVLSEALANGEIVAAAPTRGFHGVQIVAPGEPFSF